MGGAAGCSGGRLCVCCTAQAPLELSAWQPAACVNLSIHAPRSYTYLNLDDGWSERERGPDGRLVPNAAKFPSGIKPLADYVHSKGLKFGIYGDAGEMTCAKYPGAGRVGGGHDWGRLAGGDEPRRQQEQKATPILAGLQAPLGTRRWTPRHLPSGVSARRGGAAPAYGSSACDTQCRRKLADKRNGSTLAHTHTAGVDYLKYDNCYATQQQWVVDRYTAMRDALNATGRPIFYSLCDWGVLEPWLWARDVGNSWRTTEVRQGGRGPAWRHGQPRALPCCRTRAPTASQPAAAVCTPAAAACCTCSPLPRPVLCFSLPVDPVLPLPPCAARSTQDIQPTWDNVVKLLEYSTGLARFHGPGSWADMDMLYGGCRGGCVPVHGGGCRCEWGQEVVRQALSQAHEMRWDPAPPGCALTCRTPPPALTSPHPPLLPSRHALPSCSGQQPPG